MCDRINASSFKRLTISVKHSRCKSQTQVCVVGLAASELRSESLTDRGRLEDIYTDKQRYKQEVRNAYLHRQAEIQAKGKGHISTDR